MMNGEIEDIYPLELGREQAWHLERAIPRDGVLVGITWAGDLVVSAVELAGRPVELAPRVGEPPGAQALELEPLPVQRGESVRYTLEPHGGLGTAVSGWVAMIIGAIDASTPATSTSSPPATSPSSSTAADIASDVEQLVEGLYWIRRAGGPLELGWSMEGRLFAQVAPDAALELAGIEVIRIGPPAADDLRWRRPTGTR